jgi:hypothetical protein
VLSQEPILKMLHVDFVNVQLKVCGCQTNLQQLHDDFSLQDRLLCQCVINIELTCDYLYGFVNWYSSVNSDAKANDSI